MGGGRWEWQGTAQLPLPQESVPSTAPMGTLVILKPMGPKRPGPTGSSGSPPRLPWGLGFWQWAIVTPKHLPSSRLALTELFAWQPGSLAAGPQLGSSHLLLPVCV